MKQNLPSAIELRTSLIPESSPNGNAPNCWLQKFKNHAWGLLVVLFLISGIDHSWAQINMVSTGSATQNFNTLITVGSATWTDNSTIANWYSQRTGTGTTYAADAGTNNAGNLYSYGTGTNSDRALGTIGSGNAAAGSFAHGVLLRNTSGGIITDVKVSYTMEQWRNSAAGAQVLSFYYKISSSAITALDPNNNATWTSVAALNAASPITGGSAGALDGNQAANQVVLSNISIPSLSLADNDYIMLKWDDPDHTGSDHGLSIDDVTMSWVVPSNCTLPTVDTNPLDQTVCENGSAMFTASFAGGDPPPTLIWQEQVGATGPWNDLTDTPPYSGTSTNTIDIELVALSLSGNNYRLKATNSCGEVVTDSAMLTVTPLGTVVVPPPYTTEWITGFNMNPVPPNTPQDPSVDPSITGTPTTTNNCGAPFQFSFFDVLIGPVPANCPNLWTLNRTWTATDFYGNQSTGIQVLTFTDFTPPTITFFPQFPTPIEWIAGFNMAPVPPNTPQDPSIPPSATGGPLTATDNCGSPVISYQDVLVGPTPGTCPILWHVNRTWTATDNCGNLITYLQVINFSDTTPPVISCPPNQSLEWIAGFNMTPVPPNTPQDPSVDPSLTGGSATATDNCGTPTITYQDVLTGPTPGTCPILWTLTRTWKATDNCGLMSTCDQIINFTDTTPPVISCPPNQSLEWIAGFNMNPVPPNTPQDPSVDPSLTGGSATATDNCGTPTITYQDVLTGPTPGTCPILWTLTRTWKATDNCGLMSTCDQIINFTDTTPPVISCPPNQSLEWIAGFNMNPVPPNTPQDPSVDPSLTGGSATATDNCGTPTITYQDVLTGPTPGTCPILWTLTRTWKATDNCGLMSTCDQIINFTDTTPPVINCPPAITITLVSGFNTAPVGPNTPQDPSVDPSLTGGSATATDNCGTPAITYQDVLVGPTSANCPSPYVVQRTWKATDNCGLMSTCVQLITLTLPDPVCPPDFTAGLGDAPFVLTGATPAGGTYSGDGVTGNTFDPASAGLGAHLITYTYVDPGSGCTLVCSFTITVEEGCTSKVEWVFLPPGAQSGTCTSGTNCCENTLCYGLQYTPANTGILEDYTTGFLANCLGGNSPVVSNHSCVMTDNSFEINGCDEFGLVLFNSSGNQGMLPVTACVPVILHQVCFSIAIGDTLHVDEDEITDISTSIAIDPLNHVYELPDFTSTTIIRSTPVAPPDGSMTVSCPQYAVPPTLPEVLDECGSPISASLDSIVDTPDPLVCDGTRVYYYTYTECSGYMFSWSFTYTIQRNDFTVPADGSGTVACPGLAIPDNVMLPDITSDCGEELTPGAPVQNQSMTDTYDGCEGTISYTWTYTDCKNNTHTWTYTFTVEREDFMLPADDGSTVACASAIVEPTPPAVNDDCGDPITPTGPTIGGSYQSCEGTVTYTWNYLDCEGNSHDWTYTYTVEVVDFMLPANGASTVACAGEIVEPTPPSVNDNCNNPITPTGPTIGGSYQSCEGTVTYTWNYQDCVGNSHDWTYTYTVEVEDFMLPADGGDTVSCASLVFEPTPPMVNDNCGNPITPTGPTIGGTYQGCEGTITYTWNYQDCVGNNHDWVYTWTIIREDFTVPMDGADTVACPALATSGAVILPTVSSDCSELLEPSGPLQNQSGTDTYDGCDGTISYTWTYTDCAGHTHTWTYTYTIEREDFTVPADGSSTVACPASATSTTVMLPSVTSDCGEVLTPTGPVLDQFETDTYDGCEGTISYTWTYTDCAGNTHTWTYTYTVEREDFMVPADDGLNITCENEIVVPTPPSVNDNCGDPISPTGPVIGGTYMGCEGTVTYTWNYLDCEGNSHDWTYTYTLQHTAPSEQGGPVETEAEVNCYLDAVPPTVLPVIIDACGNVLTAPSPVMGGTNTGGCGGNITYTYTYLDCAGLPYEWTYTYYITCDPINLHVWLEGPYSLTGDTMRTKMNQFHTLPGQDAPIFYLDYPAGQPYSGAPWNYNGNPGTQWGDFMGQTPYPADVVDWILVTIRKNGILPANNIWTCAGWVHQDGHVSFPEDCPLPAFSSADLYYFLVQHRNHLGVLSPAEVDMPCGTAILEWDFRNANSYQPVFRFGQKEIKPGVWAMFAANGEQVSSIQAINSQDRTLWRTLQGTLGYSLGDFDLDTDSDSVDENIWKNNQNRTSGVIFY